MLRTANRALRITVTNRVIITALRVMGGLVPMSLPSLRNVTPRLSKTVFKIMDKNAGGIGVSVGGARTDVGEASLRAFTLLLRQCKHMKVNDAQLRAVLAFIRSDIDVPARQNATFAVINVRACVWLRVAVCVAVCPGIGSCMPMLTMLCPPGHHQAQAHCS